MVDLIPYSRFGRLRLADFAPSGAAVVEFDDWEFMDDRWVGEAVGTFTEFLRLEEEPAVVRAVALDLAELPPAVAGAVLGAIGLPLAPGMGAATIEARLGPAASVERAPTAPDRQTLNFTCGAAEPYAVACTVHTADGLVYVVVMAPTPGRLAADRVAQDA